MDELNKILNDFYVAVDNRDSGEVISIKHYQKKLQAYIDTMVEEAYKKGYVDGGLR